MKTSDAIREVMAIRNLKVTDVAYSLNKKSNVISERLTQTNMSIAKVNEMLRLMNYKVVIVPRDTRLQDGWFEIE